MLKQQGELEGGAYVYRTIVNGSSDCEEVRIEVFRSKEEMDNNKPPYKILSSFDELLEFCEKNT